MRCGRASLEFYTDVMAQTSVHTWSIITVIWNSFIYLKQICFFKQNTTYAEKYAYDMLDILQIDDSDTLSSLSTEQPGCLPLVYI